MIVLVVIGFLFVGLFGFVVIFGAPYVPTRRSELRAAFDALYDFTPDDVLVDIGSGDGIVLREASRRGARAVGYEINPLLVVLSRWLSRGDTRVDIRQANFWKSSFPEGTSIVYIFGESRDIKRMYAKIQREATRLNRQLCVISYGFQLPDVKKQAQAGAHFLYKVLPRSF